MQSKKAGIQWQIQRFRYTSSLWGSKLFKSSFLQKKRSVENLQSGGYTYVDSRIVTFSVRRTQVCGLLDQHL